MLIEIEREPGFVENSSLQDLVREMLCRLGEDPERDGLRDTPARMARSMEYLTKGYRANPQETLLGALFDVAYDEMVMVKDIEVFSFCEHHLLPFFGKLVERDIGRNFQGAAHPH